MSQTVLNLIYLVCIVVLYYSLIRAWYVWWQIKQQGLPTSAKVVFLKHGRGLVVKSHSVSYTFDATEPKSGADQTFNGTKGVNRPAYIRAKSTSKIDIKYLPTNPRISLVVGDNFERNFITVIGIGVPIVAVILILVEQTMMKQ